MLRLRIEQEFARIGLNIQKPFLPLRTTLPKIELNIKKPELRLNNHLPRVYIDQRRCFADMEKRTLDDFIRYYAERGREQVLKAIGDIAEEGDMLARIEEGVRLEDVAEKGWGEMADFNVTAIPKQPPDITWEVKPVEVEFIPGEVELELVRGRVENLFTPGKVEVYLEQKNYIKIDWVGENLDIKV
ncbi:hypothetical protein SAMN02745221_00451 [Thermosyntropha lipolytica DSM 11003]|uniref:Uncharacterized protein n=1 Tax=Thermosyntropha lipolytica DSM 11003 TaxID=1123382 RepID=A0A1M5KNF2_9FIRM|nr:DUF6470 family protein [Thermosyntropha lipolytica]SHG54307.1 hypothetical protein SAMN02745221_00451 [Thermosyntropha lipolytica DSM 11003]